MKNRKRHHVIYQINNNAGTCSRNRENECLIWEKEGCQSETIRQSYSSLHPRHIPGRKRIDCVSSRGNCFHNTNISKKMSKPLGVNYCACINKIAMNKIFLIIILLCTLSCKNEMEELNIPSFNLMSNMQNAKLSDFVDSALLLEAYHALLPLQIKSLSETELPKGYSYLTKRENS